MRDAPLGLALHHASKLFRHGLEEIKKRPEKKDSEKRKKIIAMKLIESYTVTKFS